MKDGLAMKNGVSSTKSRLELEMKQRLELFSVKQDRDQLARWVQFYSVFEHEREILQKEQQKAQEAHFAMTRWANITLQLGFRGSGKGRNAVEVVFCTLFAFSIDLDLKKLPSIKGCFFSLK